MYLGGKPKTKNLKTKKGLKFVQAKKIQCLYRFLPCKEIERNQIKYLLKYLEANKKNAKRFFFAVSKEKVLLSL